MGKASTTALEASSAEDMAELLQRPFPRTSCTVNLVHPLRSQKCESINQSTLTIYASGAIVKSKKNTPPM